MNTAYMPPERKTQKDVIDEELMRAYLEDKQRMDTFNKGFGIVSGGARTTEILTGTPSSGAREAFIEYAKPRAQDLLKKREETRQEMVKGKTAALEHDPNNELALALRGAAMGSDALNTVAERIAAQTGRNANEVKQDFFNNTLSKMTPAQLRIFNQDMKTMGEVTTQKMQQALINSQRLAAEAQTREINQETSNKAILYAAARNPNSAASQGYRAWIKEVAPEIAASFPNFDSMSVNDLNLSKPGMESMFEAFKHVNTNKARINAEAYVAPGVRAKVQTSGVPGLYGQVGGVAATPQDKAQVSSDLNTHPILWTSGDTLTRMVVGRSGAEIASMVKANTPEGQIIRREMMKFAEAYNQEHPQGGKYSKEIQDKLASGNIADLVWGPEGKGSLIQRALEESQQTTAKHRQRFEFDTDAKGGSETPPLGMPYTTFKNGYLFDYGDRKIYYEHKGNGRWAKQEIPNAPVAPKTSLPRTGTQR
jgi:hypothetical protein